MVLAIKDGQTHSVALPLHEVPIVRIQAVYEELGTAHVSQSGAHRSREPFEELSDFKLKRVRINHRN